MNRIITVMCCLAAASFFSSANAACDPFDTYCRQNQERNDYRLNQLQNESLRNSGCASMDCARRNLEIQQERNDIMLNQDW